MKRWLRGGVAICMSVAMLTGCSLDFSKGSDKGSQEPRSLKVMYYNESSFFQEYGMLYSAIYPNVDIEVIESNQVYNTYMEENDNDYQKALTAFIEKEQPDVMMIDTSQIENLSNEGKLYDLDTYVSDKKYNVEGLLPGVIDSMKDYGNGKVFAIPTNFYTQVLFYNKDLFDKFNIPYPTDQMTWNEVMDRAKMFPTDAEPLERVFGLKLGWSSDLSELVNTLSRGEGLKQYNEETLQMTMDTPAWHSLVEQAQSILNSDALYFEDYRYGRDGIVYFEENNDYYASEPFFSGRLAMMLEGSYYLDQIKNAQDYGQDPDSIIQNWDIVTAPVNSQNPDTSYYTNYYNLFAINASSTNIETAWNFISYVTGDEYARVKSKGYSGSLPLRTKYLEASSDRNYEAFYKLKPAIDTSDYSKLPERYQYEFYDVSRTAFDRLNKGELTVAEALAELQLKGNELLATDKMTKEEQDNYFNELNQRYMNDSGSSVSIFSEAAGEDSTEVSDSTEEVTSEE